MISTPSLPKIVAAGRACRLAVLLLAIASPAAAQTLSAAKREIVLPPRPGKLDNLVTVVVPGPLCAVVSDATGKLAVAHEPDVKPHVSLFTLDEHGQVKQPAVAITLPCPASFAKWGNAPVALAAHPKLPLLYVWQDTGESKVAAGHQRRPGPKPRPGHASLVGLGKKAKGAPAKATAPAEKFFHLLIYDIGNQAGQPRLAQACAWGEKYACDNWTGGIALDAAAGRLCVPNMHDAQARAKGEPAIGYIRIGPDGLALMDDDEAVVHMATAEGTVSVKRRAALKRAIRKAGADPDAGFAPNRATDKLTNGAAIFARYPCGMSFLPVSDHVTIVAGPAGPVVWDDENRRAQFTCVTFYPAIADKTPLRLAGHPGLPVVFFSTVGGGWVYRMEHVDGYLTLLPQRGVLPGAAIASAPVVMAKRRQFACGGNHALHLIGFDEQGVLTGERSDISLPSPSVEALAYSERFDRLYVAIEKGK